MNIRRFFITYKKHFLTALFLLSCITPSHAVSLSTHKIHLDQKKRHYDFIIHNKDKFKQKCKLYLKPITFNKDNASRLLTDGEIPLNSADPLLLFSPKKFTLEIGKPQSVKFKLRIKRKTKAQEYRSYVAVDCEKVNEDTETFADNGDNMRVSPKLIHNIPIVARVGSPNYKLSFSNLSINKNKLTVNLNKTGIYSTYGELKFIDKDSNKIVGKAVLIKMPIEAKSKLITLQLSDKQKESGLQLTYQESNQYLQPKKIAIDIN